MRETTNPNRYTPTDPPIVPLEARMIMEYVYRELSRVSALVNMLSDGQIEEVNAEPNHVRHGMIRLADGTNWNPGFGRGIYWYDSVAAAWKLLG